MGKRKRSLRKQIIREVALGVYPLSAARGFSEVAAQCAVKPRRRPDLEAERLEAEIASMKNWEPMRLPLREVDLGVEMNLIWISGYVSDDFRLWSPFDIRWAADLLTIVLPNLFIRHSVVTAYNRKYGTDVELWLRSRGLPQTMAKEMGPAFLCKGEFNPKVLRRFTRRRSHAEKFFKGFLFPISAVLTPVAGTPWVSVPLVPADVPEQELRIKEWGFVFPQVGISTEKEASDVG